MDLETIETRDVDGWTVEIALTPDFDYEPGRDDDVYPRYDIRNYTSDDERDYDGQFLPRPVVAGGRDGQFLVTPDEIDRCAELWGIPKRRARRDAQQFVDGLASELLGWYGVIVTAKRGEISGSASLWGVEWDDRDPRAREYALDVAAELIPEAIDAAARSVVGGLAPLALGY